MRGFTVSSSFLIKTYSLPPHLQHDRYTFVLHHDVKVGCPSTESLDGAMATLADSAEGASRDEGVASSSGETEAEADASVMPSELDLQELLDAGLLSRQENPNLNPDPDTIPNPNPNPNQVCSRGRSTTRRRRRLRVERRPLPPPTPRWTWK